MRGADGEAAPAGAGPIRSILRAPGNHWGAADSRAQFGAGERTYRSPQWPPADGGWDRGTFRAARRAAGLRHQTPQVLSLVGP